MSTAPAYVDASPLDVALDYARRGWSVIPLRPRDKRPALAWSRFQTERAKKAEIVTWARQFPGANLGIVTGAVSGVIVLDVDDACAWDDLFYNYDVPRTPTAQTGKGWHLYFQHPGGVVRNFARKLPGLDLRGDGGYVVAPPSVHPSGAQYSWEMSPEDTPLAPCPEWLLDLIGSGEEVTPSAPPVVPLPAPERNGKGPYELYAQNALNGEVGRLLQTQSGARNDTLNRAAFSMGTIIATGAIDRATVEHALSNAARLIGLGEEETTKTIKSGIDKGMREPRDLSKLRIAQPKELPQLPTPSTIPHLEIVKTERPAGATWADMEQVLAPITWSWRGWLPNGLLTMVAADSGTGKSALCLQLAACFIRGLPWPDGTPYEGELGRILWCEAEAAQAVNLERAKTWGLPIAAFQSPLANPLDDLHLDDPAHRAAMEAWAFQDDIRVIVLDSFSGSHPYDETSAEARELAKWLAELARNSGKPVMLIHHLRKRNAFDTAEEVTLDRVRGGSALVQPARVIWALDIPNQADKEHKRLSVIKNNLARFPESVGLRIGGEGVSFGDAPSVPRKETLQDKAENFLMVMLGRSRGRDLASKLIEEGEQAGVSKAALYRAKENLNIVSTKVGDKWFWALPASEDF